MTYASQVTVIARKVLRQLKFKISNTSLEQHLSDHHLPYSLNSISDSFNELGIKNNLIKLNSKTIPHLPDFPVPFISSIKGHPEEVICILKIDAGQVKYYNALTGEVTDNIAVFLSKLTGIALVITKLEQTKEPGYSTKKWQPIIKMGVIIMALIFLIIALSYQLWLGKPSPYLLFIAMVKMLGIFITGVMIENSYGNSDGFLNKVCLLKDSNCAVFLKSKSNTPLHRVKWSELGFIYFFSTFQLLYFSTLFNTFSLVRCLSFICLLFSIYSIFYQIRWRKYCMLCLFTLALFYLEGLFMYQYALRSQLLNEVSMTENMALLFVTALIPISILLLWIPVLKQRAKVPKLEEALNSFKFDLKVFNAIHKEKTPIPEFEKIAYPLTERSRPKFRILLILSPHCKACIQAFRDLSNSGLLTKEKVEVHLMMIFPNPSNQDESYFFSKFLNYIFRTKGRQALINELELWFDDPEERFRYLSKRYTSFSLEKAELKMYKAQRQFFLEHKIRATPSIILNNIKLFDGYNVRDLLYFIKG